MVWMVPLGHGLPVKLDSQPGPVDDADYGPV